MGKRRRIKPGDRLGLLTILAREGGTYKHPRYRVRCDCGKEYVRAGGTIYTARGCKKCRPGGQKRKYRKDMPMYGVKLYHSWIAMRRRCDPNVEPIRNKRWALRGIKVCPEWQDDYLAFERWSLANGYVPGLSLDRIDNDGDYTPQNCQWITRSENSKKCRALYDFVRIDKFEPGITEWL